MYYQVLRRPTHNQARFMHSLSFVVKNQFPFAEFYNCEVRISQVLLFEEVDRLPHPNPNPLPAMNPAVLTPPVQAQTAANLANAPPLNTPNPAEDESLEQTIQALRDATTKNSNSSIHPLASIDDRLLRAVLDLAVLVKRNTPSHRAV